MAINMIGSIKTVLKKQQNLVTDKQKTRELIDNDYKALKGSLTIRHLRIKSFYLAKNQFRSRRL